jgi:hypothetical protein
VKFSLARHRHYQQQQSSAKINSMVSSSALFIFSTMMVMMRLCATSATIYQIPCEDVDDLKAKLGIAVPGDVLVLDACVYDTISPDPSYDLGEAGPSVWDPGPWNWNDTDKEKGIIITGTTNNPADTVLKAKMSFSLYMNVVFENLTISAQGSNGYTVYGGDSDQVTIFRNCIIEANAMQPEYPSSFRNGFFFIVMKPTLIRTTVKLQTPVPNVEAFAGIFAHEIVMLHSKIQGFDIALETYPSNAGGTFAEVCRIFNSDLSQNTIECPSTAPCPIDSLVPNTAAGSKINIGWGDLKNLFHEDHPNLSIKIKFPSVLTAGETIVYRKPAAYPPPPNPTDSTGIGKPQYYQFESTAVLEKLLKPSGKAKFYFKKSMIDANFADPSKVVALLINHNGDYASKPLIMSVKKVGGDDFYKVRYKKRSGLNCVIVFVERPSEGKI